MFKTFQAIIDFVSEIYGINLIGEPMHPKILEITELGKARKIIIAVAKEKRKPTVDEIKKVYPLLEVAFQWDFLRRKNNADINEFLEKCKERIKTQGNFYGTIFEIDMISRAFLSGWDIEFAEDNTKGDKQIDFIFYKNNKDGKVAAVECHSKRYSVDRLTVDKLNEAIRDKADKFDKEHNTKSGKAIEEKLVLIDMTNDQYSKPPVLSDLNAIKKDNRLDAVVLTWREDVKNGEEYSLVTKYKIRGIDKGYFSNTFRVEIRKKPDGICVFVRNYTENEQTFGTWGTEESCKQKFGNPGGAIPN